MPTVAEIICAMRGAAPAGRRRLRSRQLARLRGLTRQLVAAMPEAPGEHQRYAGLRGRGIALPEAELGHWIGGASVLVTGGTGCIGSALMAQLARYRPARLVSVTRGLTDGWPREDGAEYLRADIRDYRALSAVFADVRPDLVFNVAAQRDPGLAEREVHRTASTSVTGLRNVVAAAARAGTTSHLVHASTGKALRPYSGDVYAASKRAAECLLAREAERTGIRCGAARFTHVVDNAIIYERLRAWSAGGVVRLHDAETVFYAQSALESAQLLLCAGLAARRGTLRVTALSDLGWPVSLLGLAVGVLADSRSDSPIYFSGHSPGYEATPFPALYDPLTAGDVSPLLNAFEAASAVPAFGGAVDVFPLELAWQEDNDARLWELEALLPGPDEPAPIRAALDELSWSLLDAALRPVAPRVLHRAAALAARHEDELSPAYVRMLDVIRRHAAAGSLVPA
jgi:NAD(P)-dependent dehydrogenase (short-subunit alcohol dehydrogenase family)